ncbi:unnamed protein product [Staurois parvus]|uniref:Uncharacterized protein n=1 Tax=Staurois parvus TaxID=386267 RepID=A0ABN9FB71_9NEOB|nr:unnamed protein product [Staurois parvus]
MMDTDRWHCWGYIDHQRTLIISALMISNQQLSEQGPAPIIRAMMISALMFGT